MGSCQRSTLLKAVVLAAGRGTRMRASAESVMLDAAQTRAADAGLKPLIPFHGHAFIEYVLTSLADADTCDVCLVVAAGDDPVRAHLSRLVLRRLRISFAVQHSPRGSADALLAAESFAAGEDFIVINADNDYPVGALRALCELPGAGLIGFTQDGLLSGNIPAGRLAAFAVIARDARGRLVDIVEKPEAVAADALISMTCWRFGAAIFHACRSIAASARGEYELPDAVRVYRDPLQVVPYDAPVLDLSRRDDIPAVAQLLRERTVSL